MRVLRLLALAAPVAAALLVVLAGTASADNCAQLVRTVGDLQQPGNVQDCLRTGQGFNLVIGAVIGVTAVGVGLAGLPGRTTPPPQPPRPLDPGRNASDACRELEVQAERLRELLQLRRRLRADVVSEFQVLANQARLLTTQYEHLNRVRTNSFWIRNLTATKGALDIVQVVGAILVPLQAARTAARALVGASLADYARAGAAKLAEQKLANAAAVVIGAAKVGEVKLTRDFWGQKEYEKTLRLIAEAGAAYENAARTYNAHFLRWGKERAVDLNDANYQINGTLAAMGHLQVGCTPRRPINIPDEPTDITLQVPQVPDSIGGLDVVSVPGW